HVCAVLTHPDIERVHAWTPDRHPFGLPDPNSCATVRHRLRRRTVHTHVHGIVRTTCGPAAHPKVVRPRVCKSRQIRQQRAVRLGNGIDIGATVRGYLHGRLPNEANLARGRLPYMARRRSVRLKVLTFNYDESGR